MIKNMMNQDSEEGIAAFLEKREPKLVFSILFYFTLKKFKK